MIHSLHLKNTGPAPDLKAKFAPRLNLLTGDNGLGKSFLLDVAWWTLTRKWPAELNTKLTTGSIARPSTSRRKAEITFSIESKSKKSISYISQYDAMSQAWTGKSGRPINPGLVLYAMSDGSFAVWDPARNYWKNSSKNMDIQERPPAYVFSSGEIWDGLRGAGDSWLSNGLIRDWASWQKEKGDSWHYFCSVLEVLSPENEKLEPGSLTRISLDDARDIPTLKMPYDPAVPVISASSGMRRIMALAYCLVWAWQEHRKASELLGQKNTQQIIFLIDEIESHLHPRWQRTVVRSLMKVMEKLSSGSPSQLILTTHSPLIMGACEDFFDHQQDNWLDLDLCDNKVILSERNFEKLGDATNWLQGEAFDLPSTYSPETEKLLEEAESLLNSDSPDKTQVQKINKRLIESLNPRDNNLFRWRYIAQTKGLIS